MLLMYRKQVFITRVYHKMQDLPRWYRRRLTARGVLADKKDKRFLLDGFTSRAR